DFSYAVRNMTDIDREFSFGISEEAAHDPKFSADQFEIESAFWGRERLDIPPAQPCHAELAQRYAWLRTMPVGSQERVRMTWTVLRHVEDHYDLSMSYLTRGLRIRVVAPGLAVLVGPLGSHEVHFEDTLPGDDGCVVCQVPNPMVGGQGITVTWRMCGAARQD